MRKRGIFVEADNAENDYSWMENARGGRPYICKKRTKKLKWKKKLRLEDSEEASAIAIREKKRPTIDETQRSSMRRETLTPSDGTSVEGTQKSSLRKDFPSSGEHADEPQKPITKLFRLTGEPEEDPQSPSGKKLFRLTGEPAEETQKPPRTKLFSLSGESTDEAQKSSSHSKRDGVSSSAESAKNRGEGSIGNSKEGIKAALGDATREEGGTAAKVPSDPKSTAETTTVVTDEPTRSQMQMPTGQVKRDEVFARIDEDVDLTKVLADFDTEHIQGVGLSDRRALNAAKKILRVAYKEKAMEKALTKEENDTISKFFSGKLPYDQNVLHVLDRALDKTIDYMQTHGTQFDEETQRLIRKRQALKAAMLETLLTKPKFIPKTWVQQYDKFHKEAMRATTGINWAKILLFYPRQRAFDDGEADVYGNFTRRHRSYWILGCILGPNDSKSFEETEREKQAKCLFMDTAIMEHAKIAKGKKAEYSSLKSINDTVEASVRAEPTTPTTSAN